MNRYDGIMEILSDMGPYELVSIHNYYCNAVDDIDGCVYLIDEFDDVMEGKSPWEVARACYYGDFRPCDKYFHINVYGNCDSFDYFDDDSCPICLEDIATYIEENGDSLENDDIAAFLEEYSEEE